MAVATMGVVVLDCPDPRRLARFYADLLGWSVAPAGEGQSAEDWVEVEGPHGRRLAFQRAPGLVPPEWPSEEHSQQFHLDLYAPAARMDEAEREALDLGARLIQGDDGGARDFRVYLDPAGHPFCLCVQHD
ncbi:VOC family protein [Streptomyces sp. AJS327]|uniref:VOC family protein n=1 Tax=Streptomyces sp. AJS327 TaxID=2545265 RepID=UPI0015DF3D59|nr:VOC family protein [Streptomyces sp. AJS327]MBA0049460.1 VOC family protein [Streptomyces sp. AJS327]